MTTMFEYRPSEVKRLFEDPGNYPGLPRWSPAEIRVKLVMVPTCSPSIETVWILRLAKEVRQVRRIEWNRGADALHRSAKPTTFGLDTELPADAVALLLRDLAAISFRPCVPASPAGVDGLYRTVELIDSDLACSLTWNICPAEWTPVAIWYDQAVSLFQRLLPPSAIQNQSA
jgi:hypothetical protein